MPAAVVNDAWLFGWTQLLTIVGLGMTGVISFTGLRTFGKWRRESIEERRIEAAIDALSIAYHSKYVFDNIRGPMIFSYEFVDMPIRHGESDQKRAQRGEFFAVLKRIERNKEFFDSVWKIQPRVMALFGPETEGIFLQLHEARRNIEVSAGLLFQHYVDELELGRNADTKRLRDRQKADINTAYADFEETGSKVSAKLEAFRDRMEVLCRPVVERGYRV
jgi:hypothetical protein